MSKIITTFVHPPIPSRNCDWQAVREGWEPGEPIGRDETESDAIADLLDLEDAA